MMKCGQHGTLCADLVVRVTRPVLTPNDDRLTDMVAASKRKRREGRGEAGKDVAAGLTYGGRVVLVLHPRPIMRNGWLGQRRRSLARTGQPAGVSVPRAFASIVALTAGGTTETQSLRRHTSLRNRFEAARRANPRRGRTVTVSGTTDRRCRDTIISCRNVDAGFGDVACGS